MLSSYGLGMICTCIVHVSFVILEFVSEIETFDLCDSIMSMILLMLVPLVRFTFLIFCKLLS